MKENAAVSEEQAADLHRLLVGKIAFLRMKVPRLPRDAGKIGSATFVVREGKVVEGVGRTLGTRYAIQCISIVLNLFSVEAQYCLNICFFQFWVK
jgi:hypothetical protein